MVFIQNPLLKFSYIPEALNAHDFDFFLVVSVPEKRAQHGSTKFVMARRNIGMNRFGTMMSGNWAG